MTQPGSVFETAEAWDVSTGTILPKGNHVVVIDDAQDNTSSGGYPELDLWMSNSDGTCRDWLVITENSIGKIAALADAVGVERPKEGEFDPETLRLSADWIRKLVGKKAGIVVREEDDARNPGQKRTRVAGYVDPAMFGSDVTPAAEATGGALFQPPGGSPQSAVDDDIPF